MSRIARSLLIGLGACLLPSGAGAEAPKPRMLEMTEAQDWQAVGRINYAAIRNRSNCTGTLIGPDLVLTAAHCLVGPDGKPHAAGNIHFVAGYFRGDFTGHSRGVELVILPAYLEAVPGSAQAIATDVALVRLAKPIPVEPVPVAAYPTKPVTIVSYRRDRVHAPSFQENCQPLGRNVVILFVDCEVVEGTSGAALFDGSGAERRVVGVVSARMMRDGRPIALAVDVAALLPALMEQLGASTRGDGS